jgi:hypothetical protein
MPVSKTPPKDLGLGGRALWRSVTADHEIDGVQRVQLHEACRMKDRCDKLDEALRGDANTWMRLVEDIASDGTIYELRITNALSKANETANTMKQLIAALRLPDATTGKQPQKRGPRGAQKPTVPGGAETGGKVTSMERARQRAASKTG